jgi:hypothetical protein
VTRLALSLLLLGGCTGKGEDTGVAAWQVQSRDLGAAYASGDQTMDLSEGATAWFAAEQFIPMLEWRQPGAEIPLYMWDQIMRPTVADDGVCPLNEASGATYTWKTYDCRSSQGYEFTGEVSETRWTESGWDWVRYDLDMEVVGDTEDRSFDRIALKGALIYVDGDGDLAEAVQVNVRATAEGLLSGADLDDPREPLWNEWALTARYEQSADGTHKMRGDTSLGSLGGAHFESDALADVGCAAAPDGVLLLQGQQTARLKFQGASDCRRCAAYTLDGEDAGEACGVGY